MKILVTGSSGHLGEALMRTLPARGHDPLGLDIVPSPFTQLVGTIAERALVKSCMAGVDAVLHTATLHKPHVVTHSRQDFVDTNITGTIDLIQRVGRDMRLRGSGRILITGSIAGFMPGTFQAVYNGTKAFIDSFSFALRNEIKDSGVTVTCLMPGATDTEFFDRAGMLDTAVGQGKKDSAAEVARIGFEAMQNGEGDVVSGWKNKLQTAVANVTPSALLAEAHRKQAEPGSGEKKKAEKKTAKK